MKKPTMTIAAFAALLAMTAAAQVNLNGRVLNPQGAPLPGVRVELIGQRRVLTSDAQGHYAFSGNVDVRGGLRAVQAPSMRDGRLEFQLTGSREQVKLVLGNLQGRQRLILQSDDFAPGPHSLDLHSSLADNRFAGMRFLQVFVGDRRYLFQDFQWQSSGGRSALFGEGPALAKYGSAAVDSIHFNLKGYEDAVLSVPALGAGTLPDVTLKQGIGFQIYFAGSGLVEDIASGQAVQLDKEHMYHLLFLGDGYTQADIDAGRYDADLKSWYTDVFRISPISAFKEAFVVWGYPVPSPERTGGDTYFRLNFGGTPQDGSTARKLWEIIEKHPFTPTRFDGPAMNWVVQFAAMDPSSLRSGYSGMTSGMTDPNNSRRRVQVAQAQTQHHEFYHAFSRVSDEYYDAGHGSVGQSKTSNLSGSINCSELPWKHLVYGGEYNKLRDSLVGAFFGTPNRAHPEFKCLMNGSHDNATVFGSSNLRTTDRLCNWCRELSLFRLYHGVGVLTEASANTAFDSWVAKYRRMYWMKFPFFVPTPTPQVNTAGTKWFMPCTGPAETQTVTATENGTVFSESEANCGAEAAE